MKKITLNLALTLALPVLLQAQYLGGNGRGDVSIESLSIPLTITGDNNAIPASCSLQQNYPNPFIQETNIRFNVAQLTVVKIVVYDIGGEIENNPHTVLSKKCLSQIVIKQGNLSGQILRSIKL